MASLTQPISLYLSCGTTENALARHFRPDEIRVLARARAEFRSKHPGSLVGEILRWQIDGDFASYMVACEEPLQLAHIERRNARALGPSLIEAVDIEHVRGMVQRERRLRASFERSFGL